MTDAAVVLLRKKMSGKYTLFKVRHDVLGQRYSIKGTLLGKHLLTFYFKFFCFISDNFRTKVSDSLLEPS